MTDIHHDYPDLCIDYEWGYCPTCEEEYMTTHELQCPICLEEMEEL